MAHVCPWWAGFLLLLPTRRLRQDPRRLLGPLVRPGMVVLEPGPGMGFFTLDIARMVGPSGRVVAVDVQEKMLAGLRRRAERARLLERIELRRARADGLGVADLNGGIDLVVALYVVHEMPDGPGFFAEAHAALRPGGALLLAEPRFHVRQARFAGLLAAARAAGFVDERVVPLSGARAVLLSRGRAV